MKNIKNQQSGFTLVEIAIVLVIIGLLLGGVLKGQELINSAKVKNLAQDFKTIELFIYGYQDRFKALPGDDPRVTTNVSGSNVASLPASSVGNGVIDGPWNTVIGGNETALFWQHVRLSNFAAGPTAVADPDYYPKNVEGGRMGITNGAAANTPVATMTGTYVLCSAGLLGKYAKQLDTTLDDGNTATGSMRTIATPGAEQTTPATAIATATIDDGTSYTVCKAF